MLENVNEKDQNLYKPLSFYINCGIETGHVNNNEIIECVLILCCNMI